MVRILHLADLHLGWEPRWEGLNFDRRSERDARLAHAIDWAQREQVDLIIIAGDLFENHTPPSELVQETKRQLSRAVAAGIAVFTVPGNHDEISYHNSVYREHASSWPGFLVQNPHFGHCQTLTLNGQAVHLYGLAYTGGLTQTSPPLATFPKETTEGFHIAVLHGSLDFDAGDRSLPVNLKALASAGFDYCALGHIHRHIQQGSATHPIVYAGMVEGKGFDDPGVGHYTLVTLKQDGVTVDKPPAPGRVIKTLEYDVGTFGDEGELMAAAASQIDEGDVIRIRLTGAPEFAVSLDSLKSHLMTKAVYIEFVNEIDPLSEEQLRQIAMEPTIRGAFVERMLQKLDQDADERQRRLVRRAIVYGLNALGGSETS